MMNFAVPIFSANKGVWLCGLACIKIILVGRAKCKIYRLFSKIGNHGKIAISPLELILPAQTRPAIPRSQLPVPYTAPSPAESSALA